MREETWGNRTRVQPVRPRAFRAGVDDATKVLFDWLVGMFVMLNKMKNYET